MPAPLPSPITDRIRHVGNNRFRVREEFVRQNRPGFNLRYMRRICRAPERVARIGAHRGWNAEQTLLAQALLVERMACVFVDHLVSRLRQTRLAPSPVRPDSDPVWEDNYRRFLALFLEKATVPNAAAIVNRMARLSRFSRPDVLRFRALHWPRIAPLVSRFLADPDAAERALLRHPAPEELARLSPRAAARRIEFAASLYADLQERLGRQLWPAAFREAILARYEDIRPYPAIVVEIIGPDPDSAVDPQPRGNP